MPRGTDDAFPIKPATTEYEVLSFFVTHHGVEYTLPEIVAHTDVSRSRIAETMAYLSKNGLVDQSNGAYAVDSGRADEVKQRLKSLDSTVKLFVATPDDDVYAEEGWTEDLPSIK